MNTSRVDGVKAQEHRGTPRKNLKLRRGDVHADFALAFVARFFNSLHDELDAFPGVAGRREAALVANKSGIAAKLVFYDLRERVVALRANS